MTACTRCAARFAGAPDVERQWIERHIARSHGVTRMALVANENATTSNYNKAA